MLKWLLLASLSLPSMLLAQDYVDLFKLGLIHNFSSSFKGSDNSTTVNSLDFNALIPVELNQDQAFLFGTSFFYYKTQLFPNSRPANLYSTTLTLGYSTKLSADWSGVFVVLPKIASDYEEFSSDDFYLGGFAIFKNYLSRRHFYRYGLYLSEEAFGVTTTPIWGFYYIDDKEFFEADVSLPISADINWRLEHFTLGIDYYGMQRTFRLHGIVDDELYTEQRRMEFAGYLKMRTPDEHIFAKAKIGYAVNRNEVYDINDKIDLYFLAWSIGDDRTQLNPDIRGSLFFKLELLYRFEL
ncbi:DUF6268 family outer membrane beta-barrel protein [Aegicerativicinus sediminis]|uniref:DUF6268 family outer membrane beta-barrel protein n=1 Tax=Aegicerativicinus sediminis TaxID=2893202 RepID=UPI001E574221|nr:DUF6268 family outer membrane beta-barrel protein [Aegicerativicinus sediminis]